MSNSKAFNERAPERNKKEKSVKKNKDSQNKEKTKDKKEKKDLSKEINTQASKQKTTQEKEKKQKEEKKNVPPKKEISTITLPESSVKKSQNISHEKTATQNVSNSSPHISLQKTSSTTAPSSSTVQNPSTKNSVLPHAEEINQQSIEEEDREEKLHDEENSFPLSADEYQKNEECLAFIDRITKALSRFPGRRHPCSVQCTYDTHINLSHISLTTEKTLSSAYRSHIIATLQRTQAPSVLRSKTVKIIL